MKTAYVLISLELDGSQNSVIGVFSDRASAESAAYPYTDTEIEEHEINPPQRFPAGLRRYVVHASIDGSYASAMRVDPFLDDKDEPASMFWAPNGDSELSLYCWAESEDAAIQKLQSERIDWLESGELEAEIKRRDAEFAALPNGFYSIRSKAFNKAR